MLTDDKLRPSKGKSITRRNFLKAALGSVAAIPLCSRSVGEVLTGPHMSAAGDHVVRLNMNENPFGPSPKAMLAAKENIDRSNLYVDATIEKFYRALSQLNALTKDAIILGTGSWEILCVALLASFDNGKNVVSTRQTYPPPLDYAKDLGFILKEVDHTVTPQGQWTYNLDGLLGAVDSETRLLYLVNPNNPTGAWLDYQQLKYLADSLPPEVLFLLDEAYIHFLGDFRKYGLQLIKEGYKNVVISRTFSKVYGLAGLRVGYGISHPDVIKRLREFTIDFLSINTSGYYGALAALQDHHFVSKSIRQAQKTLSFYKEKLPTLGLSYIIGRGPFVLADVKVDATIVVEKMAKENILVVGGEEYGMPTCIRISYGTDADNQRAIHALRNAVSG
jgi:histidinol-phosphate aminotransferase